MNTGLRVDPHIVHGWWKDTGQVQDMLEANRLILDDLAERIEGELIDSRVEGRVVIEEGARLERATVRGPAIIGRGSRITDAYIGPYTAIGEDVTIERAELEHSIVLGGSEISDLEYRIEASLIGKHVRDPARPAAAEGLPLRGRRQRGRADPVRLVVTGAGGMLGQDVLRVAGPDAVGLTRAELDVTDGDAVRAAIGRTTSSSTARPGLTWTAPRNTPRTRCGSTREGARNVAAAAGAVIYVSSDYVFDGTKDEPVRRVGPAQPGVRLRALEGGG